MRFAHRRRRDAWRRPLGARRPHPRRPHPRRHQRGAAAIETALSLIVLMFIVSAGLNFGHAMVVRHRLLTATSRAARVCSIADPAVTEGCVDAQMATFRQNFAASCAPLQFVANPQRLDTVDVLGVNATCDYVGGPWGPFLATMMRDERLVLTANSVMPRR